MQGALSASHRCYAGCRAVACAFVGVLGTTAHQRAHRTEVRPLVCAFLCGSGAVKIACVRCADLARVVLVPFGHSGACESPLDAFWCHVTRP